MGITRNTVDVHVRNAAGKLPGSGRPGFRLQLYVYGYDTADAPE